MARENRDVVESVLKHADTQLSGTAALDLPGAQFDSTGQDEWYQVRVLGYNGNPVRSGERFETWTVNINAFVRVGPDDIDDIYRPYELADTALSAFNQTDLSVQDFSQAGDPEVAVLRFGESDVQPLPTESGTSTETGRLVQVNIRTDATLID